MKVKHNNERAGSQLRHLSELWSADIHRKLRKDQKYNSPNYTYIIKMRPLEDTRVPVPRIRTLISLRPFARSAIYTSSVEFRRTIPDPAELRTRPKAKRTEKKRATDPF